MKIFFPLCLLAIAVIFTSCNDDSVPNEMQIQQSLLLGDWSLSGLSYNGVSTTTDSTGLMATIDFDGEATAINLNLVIEEAPQVFTSDGSFTLNVTSIVFGQEVEQELILNNFIGDGTWVQNDNLFVTLDTNTAEGRETAILESTENELILDFAHTNTIMVQDQIVEQVIAGAAIFRK